MRELADILTNNKIIELMNNVNEELCDGYDFNSYYLEELIELVYEDGEIINLPFEANEENIIYYCEEILKSFEEGMDGIREIEGLIECLFEAYGIECPTC